MDTGVRLGRLENPQKGRLEIIYRRIGELKPDLKNPRTHTRKQIEQLARSIESFGFTSPALIDDEDNLIAGHARLLACCKLGWSEIPTVLIEGLTQAKRRALMIADNRLAQSAQWDKRLLAEELRDLTLAELDLSVEVTGFTPPLIYLRTASLDSEPATEDSSDAEPAPTAGPTVSKPGDLWLLGDHRVVCGSALEKSALQTLMGEEHATMVFADPPFDEHPTGLGNIHDDALVLTDGEMNSSSVTAYLSTALRNQAPFCIDGALFFICSDWSHISELLAAGRGMGAKLLDVCIWVQGKASVGSLYRNQHEPIFVLRIGSGRTHSDLPLNRSSRRRSNVWRYPGVRSFSRKAVDSDQREFRPTAKPVGLVADAIRDCTARGDVILDGFLNHGTTVIAAERTRRRCYGMALDPADVETVIRRWQKLTGEAARHGLSGRTFDDLMREAEAVNAV
jgi:DNA modification methylase